MKNRIKCNNKEDREQLSLILIKQGYTVRITGVKAGGKTNYYVEYAEGEAE